MSRSAVTLAELRGDLGNAQTPAVRSSPCPKRIWIDFDNTPHVPFFSPIIRELELRGYVVLLSARDAFQTCELARSAGLKFDAIGRHYGQRKASKFFGLFARATQLLPYVFHNRPDLALSHGSRSQLLLANLLRIPSVELTDYEHVRTLGMLTPTWLIVPEVLRDARLPARNGVLTYPGIKEDVYVPSFVPEPGFREKLGVRPDEVLVTVRPPATEAHYHNPESDNLFQEFVELASSRAGVLLVILPRNRRQEVQIREMWPSLLSLKRVIIPERALDGLNLLWASDLVVSGGGTMNREAAALNLPVFSIFRGPIGAVDRQLQREGRLVMVQTRQDLRAIPLKSRDRCVTSAEDRLARQTIVDHIEKISFPQ